MRKSRLMDRPGDFGCADVAESAAGGEAADAVCGILPVLLGDLTPLLLLSPGNGPCDVAVAGPICRFAVFVDEVRSSASNGPRKV